MAVYFADICGLELPIFRAVAGILVGSLKLEVRCVVLLCFVVLLFIIMLQ